MGYLLSINSVISEITDGRRNYSNMACRTLCIINHREQVRIKSVVVISTYTVSRPAPADVKRTEKTKLPCACIYLYFTRVIFYTSILTMSRKEFRIEREKNVGSSS